MNGVLLFVFISFSFASGKFQTDHSHQPIEVQEGDNATVQFPIQAEVNLEKYTIDVKRVNGNSSGPPHIVYSRRHGKAHPVPQMEQYRNRVFLNKEDLRRGVLTLVILSVQPSDIGVYKYYIPKLQASSSFNIVVKAKQNETKENTFSTIATSVEKMTNASETEKHPDHVVVISVITIITLCVIPAVGFLFKKRICISRNRSEGNDVELETLRVPNRERR